MNLKLEIDLPDKYIFNPIDHNIFIAQYSIKERSSIKRKINIIDFDNTIIDSINILDCYLNNDYWKVILNLKDKGFSDESPFLTINPSLFSTKLICKMLDIMINKEVNTSLIEDIKLNYVLNIYCNEDIYTRWKKHKQFYIIDEEPNYNDITEVEKWIKRNVDPNRWLEVGLLRINECFHTDKYIKANINIYYENSYVYHIEECIINTKLIVGYNLCNLKIYNYCDIQKMKILIFNTMESVWLHAKVNYHNKPICFCINPVIIKPIYLTTLCMESTFCYTNYTRTSGNMIAFPYSCKGVISNAIHDTIVKYFIDYDRKTIVKPLFNVKMNNNEKHKSNRFERKNQINLKNKVSNYLVRYINQPRK